MTSLADVTYAALHGLLSLLPGNDSASQREASSLSLVVNFRHVAPSAALQTLRSVAAMESYSHSLQRYPLVKQAFWEQVLGSDLMTGASTNRRKQLRLRDERFPKLVLDFSRCKVSEELLEALGQFLSDTEVQTVALQSQFSGVKVEQDVAASIRVVPVVLKFVRCRLTADLIEKLDVLLRQAPEEKIGVNFCVTALDLSENAMKTLELEALAKLLADCGRKRLDELVLENALGRTITTDSWAAFRAFVSAAFGLVPGRKRSLKRLSLANNSLSFHHIGCVCSALRSEGGRLEELSLAHTFSLVDPVDRKACWQWLAIGLRPRECTRLRRLDLSGNPLFPLDSEAWLESLQDPHPTVIQWLEDAGPPVRPTRNEAAASTVRCLLSSSTELHLSPKETSPQLQIIEKEVKATSLESKEWEVLATLQGDSAWFCVLVPGFGVVWTQAKYAMSWEHSEDDLSPTSAVLSELVMNDMVASRTTTEALESFVGGFGGRLESLELRRNALSAMDLDAILAGCQRLRSLDVEGCRVLQLQLLVDTLSGELGRHLQVLNLNANLVGADAVNVLAAALRGQMDDVPVLQELHVAHNEIGANGVRHLHTALETNKQLTLLELDLPNENAEAPRRPDDDEYIQLYRTRCMRLDVSFQNELLGITPLSVERKFAFLMVLNHHDLVLERGICSVIFSFAGNEKRRRILWNSAHR
ncbi:hypothetical protein P3T76_014455 [Phytophthora citrophthora]|uniref:Uncharacterized protein n=1 Tax=Phytophthora citrophthora TaxID=4793 RepID=A0AAD9G142_9STRA|nr:hypothetical protein P3T76_014455 [Phytophthora citrophthora]